MARRRPSPLHTVLLICEGKTERAFLKHLQSLYIFRGCGVAVTIISADGKGPEYIVNYTIRRSHRIVSDRILTLLDTDIPITAEVRKKAAQRNIQLIESSPCFEGLLLKILNERIPATSKQCKQSCKKYFPSPLTKQENYQNLTRTLLEKRRKNIPELARLLDSFNFDD